MCNHRAMEIAELMAALARDSAAFVEACEVAGLTTPVVPCPGWTVADLLWHLTEVHDFWKTVVAEKLSDPGSYTQPPRPVAEGLAGLYRRGRLELLEALTHADPRDAVWTWSGDHTVAFVTRRMAQETAVHLCDAADAAGISNPIDAHLASDGIDEFLTHFLGDSKPGVDPVGGSVHLHCGDVAGEWTVRPTDDGKFNVAREHSKGDCAIRGRASDILLALWRRAPLAACDVVGDVEIAARFVASTSLN
jgi:uncharacterized protein (TIGR03083 family)